MKILSLDIGTTMGYAFGNNGYERSGTIRLHGGNKFLQFLMWLQENGDVDIIYYEKVRRHLGTKAAHCYGGFLGILEAWRDKQGLLLKYAEVGTIKKFCTGNGKASKGEMINAARKYKMNIVDHNEADAVCILLFAIYLENK